MSDEDMDKKLDEAVNNQDKDMSIDREDSDMLGDAED